MNDNEAPFTVPMGQDHHYKYQKWVAAGCPDVINLTDVGFNVKTDREIVEDIQQDMRDWVRKNAMQAAVSPDAPMTVNEQGGMQSHIPVRFDLLDARALFATAAVLHEGAEKYAPGNWRLISTRDHLNHLLTHVYAYLSGDRSDEHLSHAVCRAVFALGVELDITGDPEQDQT